MLPQSPRFPQAVDSFLLYCESKNLAPGTIGWYDDKLADVTRLLDDPPVAEVSLDELRRLVAHWAKDHRFYPHLASRDRGRGLAPSIINGYVRALRAMFRFLAEEGLLSHGPSSRLRCLKVVDERRTVLTAQEVRRIAASSSGSSFTERRNRCLFLLLVDAGLRVSEASGLKVADLGRSARTVTVLGKGRRARTVPFGRQTARALGSYLALHPRADTADAPLFLTDEGDPLVRRRTAPGFRGPTPLLH
jgi:site-specific recombinase XerD